MKDLFTKIFRILIIYLHCIDGVTAELNARRSVRTDHDNFYCSFPGDVSQPSFSSCGSRILSCQMMNNNFSFVTFF